MKMKSGVLTGGDTGEGGLAIIIISELTSSIFISSDSCDCLVDWSDCERPGAGS
jgi:hypothetical protein